jgi:hypothetical protein
MRSCKQTRLQSPKIEAEVSWDLAPNRTQGVDDSLVQNFEFGATLPLADSFVIRMKWIYHREYASNSLVGHDDTTRFSVNEKWHMETIKDCGDCCLRFLKFLLFEARASRETQLLPSHINRNRCQMSSLCPSRGRLSGIELRTDWHSTAKSAAVQSCSSFDIIHLSSGAFSPCHCLVKP